MSHPKKARLSWILVIDFAQQIFDPDAPKTISKPREAVPELSCAA
jgi:hypothetical protein